MARDTHEPKNESNNTNMLDRCKYAFDLSTPDEN